MLRKIIEIAIKDNRLRFSSWGELLFFLILPVAFTLFLGTGFSGNSGEGDERIGLLLVDQDRGELAAELTRQLENSEVVRVMATTTADAETRFENEEAAAWLTIPAGFTTGLLNDTPTELSLNKLPNNLAADAAEQAVLDAARRTGNALIAARSVVDQVEQRTALDGETEEALFRTALEQTQTRFGELPERTVITQNEAATTAAGDFDMGAFAAAGQLVTWVFIPLLGASSIFAYERVLGTLRRLVSTPTRKATFLLGTIGGQLAAAIIQMVLLILIGRYLMGINWGNSPAALAIMVLAFGLAAVALGTTMGTFVKTLGQANGLSIMFGMTFALLGGCWIPIETFPTAVQEAVKVLPTTWAMQGFSDIVLRGQGVAAILPEAGVLIGFAVLFFALGIWRFRYE